MLFIFINKIKIKYYVSFYLGRDDSGRIKKPSSGQFFLTSISTEKSSEKFEIETDLNQMHMLFKCLITWGAPENFATNTEASN